MSEEETDAQRKARKAARAATKSASAARKKNYYVVQKGRTADNKKRKLAKRIRQHPQDLQAAQLYRSRYGK